MEKFINSKMQLLVDFTEDKTFQNLKMHLGEIVLEKKANNEQ